MAIQNLKLTHFRNHRHFEMKSDGQNIVLYGDNGVGKTNVLEALSLLMPGRGMRQSSSKDCLYQPAGQGLRDTKDARIDLEAAPQSWHVATQLSEISGFIDVGIRYLSPELSQHQRRGLGKKQILIDGIVQKTQISVTPYLSMIWLTPMMERIFREGGAARRRFLDRLVQMLDPEHAHRVTRYEHYQRERLKLLRQGTYEDIWVATIEQKMAEIAVAVTAARRDVVRQLMLYGPKMASIHFPCPDIQLQGEVADWFETMPALAVEDRIQAALAAQRGQDKVRGQTKTGPHRDDLAVTQTLKQQPAANCSTGEQKLILIALLLAQARVLAYVQGRVPILLLDDVMAHLDGSYRHLLCLELKALNSQVWMSGTEREAFSDWQGDALYFHMPPPLK